MQSSFPAAGNLVFLPAMGTLFIDRKRTTVFLKKFCFARIQKMQKVIYLLQVIVSFIQVIKIIGQDFDLSGKISKFAYSQNSKIQSIYIFLINLF